MLFLLRDIPRKGGYRQHILRRVNHEVKVHFHA